MQTVTVKTAINWSRIYGKIYYGRIVSVVVVVGGGGGLVSFVGGTTQFVVLIITA